MIIASDSPAAGLSFSGTLIADIGDGGLAHAATRTISRTAITSSVFTQVARLASGERKRSTPLARAFEASTSRSRGGAFVTSASSRARAARATSSTVWANGASFALDGFEKPLNFRTNCRDDARISSSVAGGLKLCSVLMLRHMQGLLTQRGVA